MSVALAEAEELATLDDDERRLKISHHPDGFLQFSGQGIRSGRDENGNPKGLGTHSFPLNLPTLGPSFGIEFSNPLLCGREATGTRSRRVVTYEHEIAHMRF